MKVVSAHPHPAARERKAKAARGRAAAGNSVIPAPLRGRGAGGPGERGSIAPAAPRLHFSRRPGPGRRTFAPGAPRVSGGSRAGTCQPRAGNKSRVGTGGRDRPHLAAGSAAGPGGSGGAAGSVGPGASGALASWPPRPCSPQRAARGPGTRARRRGGNRTAKEGDSAPGGPRPPTPSPWPWRRYL